MDGEIQLRVRCGDRGPYYSCATSLTATNAELARAYAVLVDGATRTAAMIAQDLLAAHGKATAQEFIDEFRRTLEMLGGRDTLKDGSWQRITEVVEP